MRIITTEDFRDAQIKILQRGFKFFTSKFNLKSSYRTKSSFNDAELQTANWWIIPKVQERWNKLITGNKDLAYEEFFCRNFFPGHHPMKMLSIGSGVCGHEIKIAELMSHWEVHCFDFSEKLLQQAKINSDKKNLKNIFYHAEDIYQQDLEVDSFDIVFFHASLHHFKNMSDFFDNIIIKAFTKNKKGYLIINEYVGKNRLQYSGSQISAINTAIKKIPKSFRQIYKTNIFKNRYYGSGVLRMIIADPSECVDSESILPEIHKKFETIIEKPYGGNLLMSSLNDIGHHFIHLSDEKSKVLQHLFDLEDEYLKSHQSDFVFGIYEFKND